MILDLCEKFHCLPSAVLDEDTDLLRLLLVEQIGRDRAGKERKAAQGGPDTY